MSDYDFINIKKSTKLGTGAKTLVSGSNKKKKSIAQQTGYTKVKQSDGFFDMLVKEGKRLYAEAKEIIN
jgi:hypothetical protein